MRNSLTLTAPSSVHEAGCSEGNLNSPSYGATQMAGPAFASFLLETTEHYPLSGSYLLCFDLLAYLIGFVRV